MTVSSAIRSMPFPWLSYLFRFVEGRTRWLGPFGECGLIRCNKTAVIYQCLVPPFYSSVLLLSSVLQLKAILDSLPECRATSNKKLRETVSLELSFVNSNLQLLKEQLAVLNSSVEVYQGDQHGGLTHHIPMIPLGLKETKEVPFHDTLHVIRTTKPTNVVNQPKWTLIISFSLSFFSFCLTRNLLKIITKKKLMTLEKPSPSCPTCDR